MGVKFKQILWVWLLGTLLQHSFGARINPENYSYLQRQIFQSGNNQNQQNNQQSQGQQQTQYQLFAKSSGANLQINPRAIRCAQGGYFSGVQMYYNTSSTGNDLMGMSVTCSTSKLLIEGVGEVDGGSYVFGSKSVKSTNAQCNGGVMIGMAGKQADVLDVQPVCCPLNDFKDPSKWVQTANTATRSGNIYSSNQCTLGTSIKAPSPWANAGEQIGGYAVTACPQAPASSNVMLSLSMIYMDGQGIQSIGLGSCREVELMRNASQRIVQDISNADNLVDAQCQGFPVNYCTNQVWKDSNSAFQAITPMQQSYYGCELAGSNANGLAGVSLPGTFFDSDIVTGQGGFGSICDPDDEISSQWLQIGGSGGKFLDCTQSGCSYKSPSTDANGFPPKTQWFQTMISGLIESGASPGFCVAKDGSGNPSKLQPCGDLQQMQSSALSALQGGSSLTLQAIQGSNYTVDSGNLQKLVSQGNWQGTALTKIGWDITSLGSTDLSTTDFLTVPPYCTFPGIVCNNANRVVQILVYSQTGKVGLDGGSVSAEMFALKYLKSFAVAQSTIGGSLPSLFDDGYTNSYDPINLRSFSLVGTNVGGPIPSDWASKTGSQPLVPNITYFMVQQSKVNGIIPPEWLSQLPNNFMSITDSAQTCLYAKSQNSQFLTNNGNDDLEKCSDSNQFSNYQVFETAVQSGASSQFKCPFCSSNNIGKLKTGLDKLTSLQSSQVMCYVQIQNSDCQVMFTYANNGGSDASSALSSGNIQKVLQNQGSVSVNKVDASNIQVDNTNNNNNVNVNGNTGSSPNTHGGKTKSTNSGGIAAGVIVAIAGVILLLPFIAWAFSCIQERSFIKDPRSFFAIYMGTYKSIPGFIVPFLFGYKGRRSAQPRSFERGLLNKGMPANSMDLGANDVIKSDRGDQSQGYQQSRGPSQEVEGVPYRDSDSGHDFIQVSLAIQQSSNSQGAGSVNWLTNAPIFVGSGVNSSGGSKIPMFVLKPNRKGSNNRIIMRISNFNASNPSKNGANIQVNDVTITQSKQITVPHLRYGNVRAVSNYNKKDVSPNYNNGNFDVTEQNQNQVTGFLDLNLDQGTQPSGKGGKHRSETVHEVYLSVDVSVETQSSSEQVQGKLTKDQQEYFEYLKSNQMFTDEEQKNELSKMENEMSNQEGQNQGPNNYKLLVPFRYVVEPQGCIIIHQRIYSLGFSRIQFSGKDKVGKQIGQLGQVLFFDPQSNMPGPSRGLSTQQVGTSEQHKINSDASTDNYAQSHTQSQNPNDTSYPTSPTPSHHSPLPTQA